MFSVFAQDLGFYFITDHIAWRSGEGNVSTGVCHSVHGAGGGLQFEGSAHWECLHSGRGGGARGGGLPIAAGHFPHMYASAQVGCQVWTTDLVLGHGDRPARPVADPGFPRGGGDNSPQGGGNIQFCQIIPKTAWNRKNLDTRGRVPRPPPPSKSANVRLTVEWHPGRQTSLEPTRLAPVPVLRAQHALSAEETLILVSPECATLEESLQRYEEKIRA